MTSKQPAHETPPGMTQLSYKLRQLKIAFFYPEGHDYLEVCNILDEAASTLEKAESDRLLFHPLRATRDRKLALARRNGDV